MADDLFRKHERKKSDPSRSGGNIISGVPGVTTEFDPIPKAIYVGTQGKLVCNLADDDDAVISTYENAFGFMPIAVRRVIAPDTTCGDIQPQREK